MFRSSLLFSLSWKKKKIIRARPRPQKKKEEENYFGSRKLATRNTSALHLLGSMLISIVEIISPLWLVQTIWRIYIYTFPSFFLSGSNTHYITLVALCSVGNRKYLRNSRARFSDCHHSFLSRPLLYFSSGGDDREPRHSNAKMLRVS